MRSRILLTASLSVWLFATAGCGSTNNGVQATKSDSAATLTTGDTTGATGASASTSGTTGANGSGDPSSAVFHWQAVNGVDTTQSGSMAVPIDYKDPSKGNFTLYVTRHKAA